MVAGSRRTFDDAMRRMPVTEEKVRVTLSRVAPLIQSGTAPYRVLEIGSAQGQGLVALTRLGHEAFGVEPWAPATEVARQVAAALGARIHISEGRAEQLDAFDDESFDLVLAFNVMEHVTDLPGALSEIRRVLKPGGVFWFSSVSAISPSSQQEIRKFPLFPYYPPPLKRRVLRWVMAHRPHLVGHSHAPALHWFTPWGARSQLRRAGFGAVWDRWDLHTNARGESKARQRFCALAKRRHLVRLLGDFVAGGCAYAGRRPLDAPARARD